MSEKLTIFISYRRGDEQDFVERIRDWFVSRYGADNVFMDFAHIPPYVKFKDFIRQRLQESDVFIPIIGPRWLELLKAKAADDDEDYLLFEIETALKLNIMIAPIRIKGGVMPKRKELPESIRGLVQYNAPELVGGAAFLKDINNLIEAVEVNLKQQKSTPIIKSAESQQYIERANKLSNAAVYDLALEEINKALEFTPEYAPSYALRGSIMYKLGNIPKAIADYDDAIRLDPSYSKAYAARGLLHNANSNYAAALLDFSEAIRLEPQFAPHYIDRGKLRQDKGDLSGALIDYSQAIDIDPEYSDAFLNRAILYYLHLKYHAAALRDYEEYVSLGGTDNRVAGWIRELKHKLRK